MSERRFCKCGSPRDTEPAPGRHSSLQLLKKPRSSSALRTSLATQQRKTVKKTVDFSVTKIREFKFGFQSFGHWTLTCKWSLYLDIIFSGAIDRWTYIQICDIPVLPAFHYWTTSIFFDTPFILHVSKELLMQLDKVLDEKFKKKNMKVQC